MVKLADPAGAVTEWDLPYTGLSDAELTTLEQFFAAAEGTLNDFTFVDPTGNLWTALQDPFVNVPRPMASPPKQ